MPFTCEYTQNWERVQWVGRMERSRNRKWKTAWIVFCVFCLGMAAFCAAAELSGWLTGLYGLMALFCLYRAFLRGMLRMRRQWKRSCEMMGDNHYEVVFLLGDNIRIEEGGSHAVELPWERIGSVAEAGDCLRLSGREKWNQVCFYLPRAGFADGTGRAFLEWLDREHPELRRNDR